MPPPLTTGRLFRDNAYRLFHNRAEQCPCGALLDDDIGILALQAFGAAEVDQLEALGAGLLGIFVIIAAVVFFLADQNAQALALIYI